MPNIKLKDRNGKDIIYENILSVTFDCEDGTQATFVYVSQATGTTAYIDTDGAIVLNNATVDASNVLELDGAIIDESGYLVIEKEGE